MTLTNNLTKECELPRLYPNFMVADGAQFVFITFLYFYVRTKFQVQIKPHLDFKLKIYLFIMLLRPTLIFAGHASGLSSAFINTLVWVLNHSVQLMFYYMLFSMLCISKVLEF